MNVLVTGGAGYIGSHICKALSKKGIIPVTIDDLSRGHKEFVQWGPFYQVNISDTDEITEILKKEKIQSVFHFAAYAYVGESTVDPVLYYQNNVLGSLSLLNAMKKAGIHKIIFSSTCATYGIPDKLPIEETCFQNPINPYGKSKLMVEQILREFVSAHQFSAVALRYFNAAGADSEGQIGEKHEPETHLIPLILEAAHDSQKFVSIFGDDYNTADGTCIRDYIHVEDLADAHILAMQYLEKNQGFFDINLGTGKGLSVKEIIRSAEQVTGRKVISRISRRRAGDAESLVAAGIKAKKILHWEPKHSEIRNIIHTANQWYLKQK